MGKKISRRGGIMLLLFAIISIAGAIGLAIGAKYSYKNIGKGTCILDHCNFTLGTCYRHRTSSYDCIIGDLIYNLNYKGKNYTYNDESMFHAESLYVAEAKCNYMLAGNKGYKVTCYFDESNIKSSITTYEHDLKDSFICFIIFSIMTFALGIIFCLISLAVIFHKSKPSISYEIEDKI